MTNKSKKRTQNYRKSPHKTRHCAKYWMTNRGKNAPTIIGKYHTKTRHCIKDWCQTIPHEEQQKRQRLMASALKTSAKVGKREELCHTLHKDGRRTLTQACFHEHPERHTHRRLGDQGVPVLHEEPNPARLRQLLIVIKELEQRSTPRAPACRHERNKSANLGKKRTTERAIHRTKPQICKCVKSV